MGVVLRASARRTRRLLLLVGLAFAALPAGSALADITIGQVGGDRNAFCPGPVVRADTNYVVPPGGGVITSFSFQSIGSGQRLDFLILRPAGGGSYTVVGKSGLVTLKGTGLQTFPVNPPITVQGGDILGLFIDNDGAPACDRLVRAGGGETRSTFGLPDPIVGQTVSVPVADPTLDLNESANLATVSHTIGQVGGNPNVTCGPLPFVRADTNYVVPPGGGFIPSFSFQSSSRNTGQRLVFLALRPAGGGSYTVVGKTGLVTLKGTGLETFPVNPPITVQGGDLIGLWHPDALTACFRDVSGGGGAINSRVSSEPNAGQSVSLPFASPRDDLNELATLVTVGLGSPPPPPPPPRCQRGDRDDKLRCRHHRHHHHHDHHHHHHGEEN